MDKLRFVKITLLQKTMEREIERGRGQGINKTGIWEPQLTEDPTSRPMRDVSVLSWKQWQRFEK